MTAKPFEIHRDRTRFTLSLAVAFAIISAVVSLTMGYATLRADVDETKKTVKSLETAIADVSEIRTDVKWIKKAIDPRIGLQPSDLAPRR